MEFVSCVHHPLCESIARVTVSVRTSKKMIDKLCQFDLRPARVIVHGDRGPVTVMEPTHENR